MTSPLKEFSSDQELLAFAQSFVNRHIQRFEKDIAICLTAKEWGEKKEIKHAYFPGLMTCIGFLEFFSGLYIGKLEPKLDGLKEYAKNFMPESYTALLLTVLYHCFRHKIAHISHPYDVLDTCHPRTKNDFPGDRRRLITWTVDESDASPAIVLEELSPARPLKTAPAEWNVLCDHLVHVHLDRLAKDIVGSIGGYLNDLKTSDLRRRNFTQCMNEYFPT